MTEKQFTFNKDTVATNLKTPITYNNKTMSIGDVLEKLNELAEENEQLRKDATTLIYANQDYRHENKRLTDKLNKTALELVDGYISQGKATEISEMSYREFLDYRAKNGKPMELQK